MIRELFLMDKIIKELKDKYLANNDLINTFEIVEHLNYNYFINHPENSHLIKPLLKDLMKLPEFFNNVQELMKHEKNMPALLGTRTISYIVIKDSEYINDRIISDAIDNLERDWDVLRDESGELIKEIMKEYPPNSEVYMERITRLLMHDEERIVRSAFKTINLISDYNAKTIDLAVVNELILKTDHVNSKYYGTNIISNVAKYQPQMIDERTVIELRKLLKSDDYNNDEAAKAISEIAMNKKGFIYQDALNDLLKHEDDSIKLIGIKTINKMARHNLNFKNILYNQESILNLSKLLNYNDGKIMISARNAHKEFFKRYFNQNKEG
jgi:hypothetical protein